MDKKNNLNMQVDGSNTTHQKWRQSRSDASLAVGGTWGL